MDAERFDTFVRLVTAGRSRRDAVRLLMTAVAAGVGVAHVREAGAQCLENGERCDPKASPNGCCSGKCSRRRKKCRAAPGQSICTVESTACGAGSPTRCAEDLSNSCLCNVTSRGYSFCGVNGIRCFPCETDADCKKDEGWQPGDRCVECTSCATNARGCAHKCPNPA